MATKINPSPRPRRVHCRTRSAADVQDRPRRTSIGLARYDGYTFTTYKPDPDDPASLAGRLVMDLYEDSSGTLWVATRGGLHRFDRENDSFVRYRHDPGDESSLDSDWVSVVLEDRSGDLWVGTGTLEMYTAEGGLNRLDRESGKVL